MFGGLEDFLSAHRLKVKPLLLELNLNAIRELGNQEGIRSVVASFIIKLLPNSINYVANRQLYLKKKKKNSHKIYFFKN